MSTASYSLLKLDKICPDPQNPRKYFNEIDLQELTESIKQNGVIQPIMVRPNGKTYMIVCGERRFRASKYAKMKEIPAIIKELSDDQSLEIQIIENLQRKDVHPLEEAEAYNSLSKQKTTAEIAKQVGKTENFVTKRLQLCKLSEAAKQIFHTGEITIENASKLATLDHLYQDEIIHSHSKWYDWNDYLKNIFSSREYRLSEAKFPISEPNYIESTPSCIICPFNSANKPLLFDDGSPNICTKKTCFIAKTQEFEKRLYDDYTVIDTSYSKDKQKQAIAAGLPIVTEYEVHYTKYHNMMSLVDWLDDYYDVMGESDIESDMIQSIIDNNDAEDEKEIYDLYEAYKNDCMRERGDIDDKITTGELIKAFDISTNQFRFIKAVKGPNAVNEENQLIKLIVKDRRADFLDKVKVYELMTAQASDRGELAPCKSDTYNNLREWVSAPVKTRLSEIDEAITVAFMYNDLKHDHEFNKFIESKIKSQKLHKKGLENFDSLFEIIVYNSVIKTYIQKYWMMKKAFPTFHEAQEDSNILTYTSMKWASHYMGYTLTDIHILVNEKAAKRKERFNLKKAELEK